MGLSVGGARDIANFRENIDNDFLPLPVLQISHFAGSLMGAALLFLARGIQRRLDAAWHLAVAMLAVGVLFCLTKGLDYEEATILVLMLLALLP